MTYTIKPLAWESRGEAIWHVRTILGLAVVRHDAFGWHWEYRVGQYGTESGGQCCDSAEDGKRQAEAFHLSRLLPALEPHK